MTASPIYGFPLGDPNTDAPNGPALLTAFATPAEEKVKEIEDEVTALTGEALGGGVKIRSGSVAYSVGTGVTNTTGNISLSGLFTGTPAVVVTPTTSNGVVTVECSVCDLTSSGFKINIKNLGGSTYTGEVSWVAIGN